MAAPAPRAFTAPVAGLSATSPGSTAIGDMVVVTTWERAGAGVPTHTVQSGFTEIRSQPHDDGSTDGRLSTAYKVATAAGAQSYQAYTSSLGTETWTGIVVLKAGTFDTAGIVSASQTTTTNAAPNPALVACPAGYDWIILAIAGWHLTASQVNDVTPPAGYIEGYEIAGAATGELSLAYLTAQDQGDVNRDPAAFADTQAPNGTSSMTIAIRSPEPSDGVWVKKIPAVAASAGNVITLVVPTGGIAAGELIIVAGGRAFATAEGSIASVTDTQGNTYTVDEIESTGTAFCLSVASCIVGTALNAGDTLTVTFNGTGTQLCAHGHVFHSDSGWVAPPLDLTADAGGTSTSPSSGATGTTSQADELVFGAFDWVLVNSWGETGSGFTGLSGSQASGDRKIENEYKVVSATGAQTADGALSASAAWNAIVATYKIAATTEAHSGSSSVRGGGAAASAVSKGATQSSSTRGGGAVTGAIRKGGAAVSTVRGGGTVSSVGAPAGPPAVSGTSSVRGGGSVASSTRKGGSATSAVRGGGSLSAFTRKGATGTSSVRGGGGTFATGREGALRDGQISGGGRVTSSGAKQASGSSSVRGGGSIASSGTSAEAHAGSSSVRGGGRAQSSGRHDGTVSSSVRGGGRVSSSYFVPPPAKSGSSSVTGGGSLAIAWRTARFGTSRASGGGFVMTAAAALAPALPPTTTRTRTSAGSGRTLSGVQSGRTLSSPASGRARRGN